MRAICDYIFGKYQRRLDMVRIRDVRKYASYHFALLARLFQPSEAGKQRGYGGLPAHIRAVHGGRKDTRR